MMHLKRLIVSWDDIYKDSLTTLYHVIVVTL